MSNHRHLEFYSSVGGAAFMEKLLATWEHEGWSVRRCHALSEAEYRKPVGRLGRLRRRWQMYGGYGLACWSNARATRRQQPIRVVTTNPFFAPPLVQSAAKGSGATINLLYDLYPEALEHAGVVRPGGWFARRCAAVTRRALRECDATVFLGERLRRHAEAAHGPARKGAVIAVGADGGPFRDFPPQPVAKDLPVRVLYSGQMGRMHDVDTLLAALSPGVPAGVEFAFNATGAGCARLTRELAPGSAVRFGGGLADADWQRAMREAHVALITVARGAERVVMPSKTYSALVAGQAVLAVATADSDLAELVRRHDCGWVIEPGDGDGLRRVLQTLNADRTVLLEKRRRAFDAGHRCYDQTVLVAQWKKLFGELMPAA